MSVPVPVPQLQTTLWNVCCEVCGALIPPHTDAYNPGPTGGWSCTSHVDPPEES